MAYQSIVQLELTREFERQAKQLKSAKWVLETSLMADSSLIIRLLPADILAIVYVFVKLRKALVDYMAQITEKRQKIPVVLPVTT